MSNMSLRFRPPHSVHWVCGSLSPRTASGIHFRRLIQVPLSASRSRRNARRFRRFTSVCSRSLMDSRGPKHSARWTPSFSLRSQ